MKHPNLLPPPSDKQLAGEIARLRAWHHTHDACVVLYDAWGALPNRQLQAEVASIATALKEIETRLGALKVLDPQPEARP